MEHEYKNKGYKLEEKDRDINWMLRSHTPVRAFASQTEIRWGMTIMQIWIEK